jgi:hypothetical protein
MPALAPVERPLDSVKLSLSDPEEALELEEPVPDAVGEGSGAVLMLPPEVGSLEEMVLVSEPKRERSRSWNSTVMGCAHMLMEPETAISLSLPRAETVVVPLNWEMQPMKSTEEEPKKLMEE